MDVLDNLVACCVRCNSSKGATRGNVPGKGDVAAKWDGLSGVFLGLAPRYEDRLSAEDLRWAKALERERVHPDLADLEAHVQALRQMKAQAPTEPAG